MGNNGVKSQLVKLMAINENTNGRRDDLANS